MVPNRNWAVDEWLGFFNISYSPWNKHKTRICFLTIPYLQFRNLAAYVLRKIYFVTGFLLNSVWSGEPENQSGFFKTSFEKIWENGINPLNVPLVQGIQKAILG